MVLTAFALLPAVWIVWLGRHDLAWASALPVAAAALLWTGATLHRHAS
jgi:hypothetical protein